MRKSVGFSIVVLVLSIEVAQAGSVLPADGSPMPLTDEQMQTVTAGEALDSTLGKVRIVMADHERIAVVIPGDPQLPNPSCHCNPPGPIPPPPPPPPHGAVVDLSAR